MVWRSPPGSRSDLVMRPEPWQRNTLIILFLTCVVAYLAVIQFGTSFALSQARYYFPAVNAGALLFMLGLRTLLPGRTRPAAQGIVFGAFVLLNIVILTGYVLPFTVTVDDPVLNWTWG